uniref:Uncharacterized protein n=1 Tax=Cyclocybe aegerita TaxID=1973307 RepID=A0A884P6I7_CYCAE|nr:hypothetical protein K4014_mgp21 [Cyclocybe aegerita]QQP21455.1 hypothetical protein [Cyclocybe aegerita]
MNFLQLFIKSLKYISKGTNYLIKYLSTSTRFQFITKYFILISEYLDKYRIIRFLKYFKVFTFIRYIIRILATINLVFCCIVLYCFSDFTFAFDWRVLFATSSIFLDSLIMDGNYIKNGITEYIKNLIRRFLRRIYNKTEENFNINGDFTIKDNEVNTKYIDNNHDKSINYKKYIIIGISVVVLAYIGYNYHDQISEVIVSSGVFKYILDYFKKDDKGKGTDSNLPLPDIINIPSTSKDVPSTTDPLFNDNPSGSTTKAGLNRPNLRIDPWGWIKKVVGKIWSPSDELSPNARGVLNQYFDKPDTSNLGGLDATSSNYPSYPAEVPINPQATPQVEISTQATPQVEISTQATPQVEAHNSPTSTGSITPTATSPRATSPTTPSYTRPFPNLGEELPRYDESSTSASEYVDPFDPV